MNISFTLTPMQIWKMHDRNISLVSVYKSLHVALICFIVLFLPSNKLPLYMLDECSMKAIKNGQNYFIVSVVQGQLNYHSVFHMWICTVVYMSVLLSMNTSAQTCMHELKKKKKTSHGLMSLHVELMCRSEGGCVSLTEVQTSVAYLIQGLWPADLTEAWDPGLTSE